MQRCQICQTTNRLGSRYCNACGTPFAPPVICGTCGAALPPAFRHCGMCGARLGLVGEPAGAGAPAPAPILETDPELPDFEADVPTWLETAPPREGIAPRVLPDWLFLTDRLLPCWLNLPELPDWLFEPEPPRSLPIWLFLAEASSR